MDALMETNVFRVQRPSPPSSSGHKNCKTSLNRFVYAPLSHARNNVFGFHDHNQLQRKSSHTEDLYEFVMSTLLWVHALNFKNKSAAVFIKVTAERNTNSETTPPPPKYNFTCFLKQTGFPVHVNQFRREWLTLFIESLWNQSKRI